MSEKVYRKLLSKLQFEILESMNNKKPEVVPIQDLKKLCHDSDSNLLTNIFIIRKKTKNELTIKNYRGRGYALEKGGW